MPRRIGLIRPWHQMSTAEGIIGSQIRTEGLRINGFPRRSPQPRLLGMGVASQVSAAGCSYCPALIPRVAPQGQRHIIGGSAPPRSEQLVRNIPGPHFTERDSKILHWRGHEDQGPGIRQPSETVPGRTSGGGRGGGNAHNLTQSGRSGGKSRCSGCTMVRINCH